MPAGPQSIRSTADCTAEEATLANNRRLVAVDRGGGPYRILYVSGRPNWEFKFLRRALADDDQLDLVGLLRIAKREPKFSFRRRGDQPTNQLFEGFENPDGDAAENYDEPVLVRLGTEDENELRDGFPKTADELYRYDALVLDDVEAAFFTQDQLTLIDDFVSRRGGGLLMLGGAESFLGGEYRRTPVANALPVYLDPLDGPSSPPTATSPEDVPRFRLALTREGWLEPWVRLRKTEPEDRERLAKMPPFQTVNAVGRLKPGATVLAECWTTRARPTRRWWPSGTVAGTRRRSRSATCGGGACAGRTSRTTTWKRRGGKPCAGWWARCRSASRSMCKARPTRPRARCVWSCACATRSICRWTTPK